MTDSWPLGWATGDLMQASEFKKGIGSLADTTLGGSAANIDITGIVGTYAHLLIMTYARGDLAGVNDSIGVRFNGDTAGNYDRQYILGKGAAVTSIEAFAQTLMFGPTIPGNTAGANLFGAGVMFIPNYASASNNKICLSLSGEKQNTSTGGMLTQLLAGFWRSSAAINRITLLPATSGNFVAGTRVTLYGMGA